MLRQNTAGVLALRYTRGGYLFNMPMIGATAAPKYIQMPQAPLEGSILITQLSWITNIQVGRFIQFGMAHARGIGAQAMDALHERFLHRQFIRKMGRMGAV